jgi:hypothetical protein
MKKKYTQKQVDHWIWIGTQLTYRQYVKFTKIKNCHYCGVSLTWAYHKVKGKSAAYNIDRKDSNKGYTIDNCVACCPRCNWAKNADFSYDEWIEIGKTIKKFRETKHE